MTDVRPEASALPVVVFCSSPRAEASTERVGGCARQQKATAEDK